MSDAQNLWFIVGNVFVSTSVGESLHNVSSGYLCFGLLTIAQCLLNMLSGNNND